MESTDSVCVGNHDVISVHICQNEIKNRGNKANEFFFFVLIIVFNLKNSFKRQFLEMSLKFLLLVAVLCQYVIKYI